MSAPRLLSLSMWVVAASTLGAHPGHSDPHPDEQSGPQVVVVEFSDFHCGPCADVSALLRKLVDVRKVPMQVIFKHAPSHPDALAAHEAALAAGKQGKFWEMHDLLFQNPKANYSEILKMARTLGLDIKRFQTSIDEREFRGRIMTEIAEARGLGLRITPTVFLNGRRLEGIDQIRAFVEAVTNPPADQSDPDRLYTFDLAGSPVTGPEDAPITIVEFSDFRCGFCGAHSKNVTQLMEAYPGKIRRVFKHFPIQNTPEGMLPHQGSMAAMAQGRFWDIYRALMNKPLTGLDDLLSRAVAVGLDMERFQRDLAAQEGMKILQRDLAEGDNLGIRMTPTTFINGRMLGGRQSFEVLKQHVEAILHPETAASPPLAETSLPPGEPSVEIEFFVDFASAETARLHAILTDLRAEEPTADIRFLHFPSSPTAALMSAHKAVLAAEQQSKQHEMAQLILASEKALDPSRVSEFAARLGLDREQFAADFVSARTADRLAQDIALGQKREIAPAPVIFVNGTRVEGLRSAAHLIKVMNDPCCSKRRPAFGASPLPTNGEIDIFAPGPASP